MDVQEAKLRQKMKGTGVSVTRSGDQIILNMPNNVTFDSNASQLKPAGANTLSGVAMVLKEYEDTRVHIIGHTDSSGSRELNMRLSEQRAESVGTALITMGVDASRLSMSGVGPDQPVASNSTAAGKAQNRRVTLTLSPTKKNGPCRAVLLSSSRLNGAILETGRFHDWLGHARLIHPIADQGVEQRQQGGAEENPQHAKGDGATDDAEQDQRDG